MTWAIAQKGICKVQNRYKLSAYFQPLSLLSYVRFPPNCLPTYLKYNDSMTLSGGIFFFLVSFIICLRMSYCP